MSTAAMTLILGCLALAADTPPPYADPADRIPIGTLVAAQGDARLLSRSTRMLYEQATDRALPDPAVASLGAWIEGLERHQTTYWSWEARSLLGGLTRVETTALCGACTAVGVNASGMQDVRGDLVVEIRISRWGRTTSTTTNRLSVGTVTLALP